MDPPAILFDIPPAAYTIGNLCYGTNMMWWQCDRANTNFLSLHLDLPVLDISCEKNHSSCTWVEVVPYIPFCGWVHCMYILITTFCVAFTCVCYEKPGRLQSLGCRVIHDWAIEEACTFYEEYYCKHPYKIFYVDICFYVSLICT